MNLHFIPLNKYDNVIEHFDGTITIPPFEKKRYLFTCQQNNNIYLFNNIDGSLYTYSIDKNTIIQINSGRTSTLKNKIGIACHSNFFVSFDPNKLMFFWYNSINTEIKHAIKVDFEVNNFTIHNNVIWACDRKTFTLYKILLSNFKIDKIEHYKYKGIGNTSLLVRNNELFITDSEENTIRCYDLSGKFQYEAITPFIDPIGQVYYNQQHYILYGGLVNEVGYENRCWQEQKPFFHALKLRIETENNFKIVYSNAFEVDFFYEEHFYEKIPEENFPMTIRLALPNQTYHQKIVEITPLGLPFEKITENNQTYAQFTINEPNIKAIGYKATLQLQSVKFNVIDIKKLSLKTECLLTENEKNELEIENPYFDQFINDEKTDLEKVKKARNQLYSKLYYKKNIYAKSFVEVLKDGYGTCGDYTSLLLIFLTKNNIACQSVGGYKIPRFYISQSGIMSIYYNHAWIEVFDKENLYALPIESSTDDKEFEQHFSEGQFLGIDWTHIKLYNGKANPNLVNIYSHPKLHPFDVLKKAEVFVVLKKEL
ncbi:MAG: transglutaminase-like domain-containing protein [Bacteroidales bacterium]